MKKVTFSLLLLLAGLSLFSQTYRITWGEDIKLRKGTGDLDIIAADNSGLYFTESRLKRKSYIVFSTATDVIKLYKVDKNFGEVFDKEYKKELKGLSFHSFQTLENDLYMFATDYEKKDKLFKVYGAKIDKNSGDLLGDFTELGSYPLESKKDDYEMKMTTINNGNSFLMVSNISGKDRVSLGINVLDKNFRKKENTIINLNFEPGNYSLQDVKLTADNKIVLLGKEYEETLVGRKKRKRMIFKQYVLGIYNTKGNKEKSISLESGDKFVINGRLVEQPGGGLLLAGFYSNTSNKNNLSGFFFNKINMQSGELEISSFKEINSGMLGKNFVDDGDTDKEEKDDKNSKEADSKKAKGKDEDADDDDADELPNQFIIRSIDINPADNSIVITSEISQYSFNTYTSSSYNSMTRTWDRTTEYIHKFTNKDILIINADSGGKIRWVNDIAKSQSEEIRTTYTSTYGGSYWFADYSNYFARAGAMPYYSSYISLLHNNNLVIIMNDHTSNNVNPEYGDKVKIVYNFRKKSNSYGISVDLATGKMTRKFISTNSDETILMPRLAYVVKSELYVPTWRQRALAKTTLKFAKIIVK